jgi:membrane protease YdiL (CAAX protease family)
MEESNTMKPMPLWEAVLYFGIPTLYFIFISFMIFPFLDKIIKLNESLAYLLGGLFLFIPMFIFVIILYINEGNKLFLPDILKRLRIKKITSKDWIWILCSIIAVYLISGIMTFISVTLSVIFKNQALILKPQMFNLSSTNVKNIIFLILWIIMFAFNILGEEMLWRGYILPRMELKYNKFAWLFNSILWMFFHIPFGIKFMIFIIPVIFILPFTVYKTKNTSNGMIIHGFLNGQMVILTLLGVIK